jgi:hypothetical protein
MYSSRVVFKSFFKKMVYIMPHVSHKALTLRSFYSIDDYDLNFYGKA